MILVLKEVIIKGICFLFLLNIMEFDKMLCMESSRIVDEKFKGGDIFF